MFTVLCRADLLLQRIHHDLGASLQSVVFGLEDFIVGVRSSYGRICDVVQRCQNGSQRWSKPLQRGASCNGFENFHGKGFAYDVLSSRSDLFAENV